MRSPWPWLALSLSGCLLAHEAARTEDPSPPPVFDPNEVYLLGRPRGVPCSHSISPWRAPTRPITDALPCVIDRAVIRGQDGRLLYQVNDTGHGFLAVSEEEAPYEDPVDTTGCGDHTVDEILVNPDGAYVYRCHRSWYDARGDELTDISAYGTDDTLLLGHTLWNLSRGTQVPIRDVEETDFIFASRAVSDGFWLAVGNGLEGELELRHVDLDGTLSVLGSYGTQTGFTMSWALSARGDLFRLLQNDVDGRMRLERRTLDGVIDTLALDGPDDTLVERLVTGP